MTAECGLHERLLSHASSELTKKFDVVYSILLGLEEK